MKARVCAKNAVLTPKYLITKCVLYKSFKAYERHQGKSQINFETLNGETFLNMQHKV